MERMRIFVTSYSNIIASVKIMPYNTMKHETMLTKSKE